MMTTVLLLLILISSISISISIWIGFYQLVKQQGRILLRLDKLEQGMHAADSGQHDAEDQPAPDEFLGTDFPPFKFPDLHGKVTALEDFRGKQVLLVNWNFDCGF